MWFDKIACKLIFPYELIFEKFKTMKNVHIDRPLTRKIICLLNNSYDGFYGNHSQI